MPTQNQQQNEILSQIEVVKQFNDFSKIPTSSAADSLVKDLKSKLPFSGKKLGDYQNDINKAVKDTTDDLFKQIIEIANTFISTASQINNAKNVSAVTNSAANTKTVSGTTKTKLYSTSKLQEYAHIALEKTIEAAPIIVSNDIKAALFAGDGICGTDLSIMIDDVRLSPSEIDFFQILQIDPTTATGQIMYEPKIPSTGRIKFDRELYKTFTTNQYDFYGLSKRKLFTLNWDINNQNWNVTGLTQGLSSWTVENVVTGQTVYFSDFFNDYYSSIEYAKLDDVIKKALLLTVQSDDSATPAFNSAFNDLNRLLSKLFAVCGAGQGDGTDSNNLVNQTPAKVFNENDQDIDSYFNFNNVEGIDLDAEDARIRQVLRFTDCNNFEIPVNKEINKDFVYLVNRKPTIDAINQTIEKTAAHAHANSNSSIPRENFHINLLNNYILNLPKAFIGSVLGPKMFFPLVLVYKIYVAGVDKFLKTKDLMQKLSKLFNKIIQDLFWKFLNEFWRLIKRDLLRMLGQIIASIIANKNKRFLLIITSLLSILKRLLSVGLNCEDYFGMILTTIKSALNGTGKPDGNLPFPDVPGFILSNAYLLPGYSQDRSLMNIIGKMQKAGINMNPIYGVANDIIPFVKSIIDGHIEEQDTNGFTKVSNKLIVIPQAGPVPPIVIPPGALILSGKVF
jgi:hypothetical protein